MTLLLENRRFCLVKSLSRLCSSQSSKDTRKKEYCLRCLNHFPSKKALEQHEEYCDNYDAVKLTLPEKHVVGCIRITSIWWECPLWFMLTLSLSQDRLAPVIQIQKKVSQKISKAWTLWILLFCEMPWKVFTTGVVHKNERRKCIKHFGGTAWEGNWSTLVFRGETNDDDRWR